MAARPRVVVIFVLLVFAGAAAPAGQPVRASAASDQRTLTVSLPAQAANPTPPRDDPLCPLDWSDGFAAPGFGEMDAEIRALCVFDDGFGPALYAGGHFTQACDATAYNVARWDGQRWSPLGKGPSTYEVYALCAFDDGTGPALYAGTSIYGVYRWDGTTWASVGDWPGDDVDALCVFDDGTGPALYAGGSGPSAHASFAAVQKWTGTSWQAVGGPFYFWDSGPTVFALSVYDDGTGPALYAGGEFTKAAGVAAYNVAKWDGTTWSAFGGGGVDDRVYALHVHDDGTGPALYVGGRFEYTGQGEFPYLARWDGAFWSSVGGPLTSSDAVHALCTYDDGTGPALYAGSWYLLTPGGALIFGVGRWDGQTWSTLAGGTDPADSGFMTVYALAVFDAPGSESGPALYLGGSFRAIGGVAAPRIARWEAGRFWPLGEGNGLSGRVSALTTFDDGTGLALYAAGGFATAGPVVARGVARWDGTHWSAVGSGTRSGFRALCVFDDGTGPALYAGGGPFDVDGLPQNFAALRWDGRAWSPLGAPAPYPTFALAVCDDGGGPTLYAASYSAVKKWDGTTWSSLGGYLGEFVSALAVYDDGTGPALYAGGYFTYGIVRWDGTRWRAVDGGVTGDLGEVRSLCVFDDGSGPALYATGAFDHAGAVPANSVAKWNGAAWSPLDAGLLYPWQLGIGNTLSVFDDGSGPGLYVGGGFRTAGACLANGIAKWDGRTWSSVGPGMAPRSFGVFAGPSGQALYVGGDSYGLGKPRSGIGRWGCVPGMILGDTNCDGVINARDIDAFVYALLQPDSYQMQYPHCNHATADCNRDGFVNNQDIDAFIRLLIQ